MHSRFLALTLSLICTSVVAAEPRAIVRVDDGDAHWRQRLGQHFGHLPRDRKRGDIVLDVDAADWRWLQAQGYAPRFDAALSAQLQTTLAKTIPGYGCYSTVEETDAFIDAQVSTHPALASVVDIGDSWEKATPGGAAGFDLRVLRITNTALAGDKPRMFVMSGLHAREYTPVQVNLKFAEWLLSNHGTNAEATWLLDHNEFHLLLQANPDGRKIAESGSSQRKNRHYFGSCSGTGIGVDLNRNFPFYWNQVPGGSSGSLCSDTYRGPSAGSEPETQAVNAYVDALFPDTRGGNENSLTEAASVDTRGAYFDLHSYSQIVMHPWGVT
ncbi:MAG TPA: M14 family zinc carboxypeptidase, partial [Patescibacteria group bacterium]|nr:M14 family zinc carboxypeptidase [Patescibacteria group bacterium]